MNRIWRLLAGWLGYGRASAGTSGRAATAASGRTPASAPDRAADVGLAARAIRQPGRCLVYAPEIDGQADPGEVVWTWVTYEEDSGRGKDRPVLVVGRERDTLLGLMLSTNARREGQRHWLCLGAGGWDKQSRPSWIRLDRVLVVPEDGIRREGAILDRARFEQVAQVLRSDYDWL